MIPMTAARWHALTAGIMLLALGGLSAFVLRQTADSAGLDAWRAATTMRLDRIEDKLDRLIERKR